MTVVVSAGRKTFGTVVRGRLKAKTRSLPRQIDKNKPAPPTCGRQTPLLLSLIWRQRYRMEVRSTTRLRGVRRHQLLPTLQEAECLDRIMRQTFSLHLPPESEHQNDYRGTQRLTAYKTPARRFRQSRVADIEQLR